MAKGKPEVKDTSKEAEPAPLSLSSDEVNSIHRQVQADLTTWSGQLAEIGRTPVPAETATLVVNLTVQYALGLLNAPKSDTVA